MPCEVMTPCNWPRRLKSIKLALPPGLGSNESYIAIRGARATKENFIDALKQVPDSEPPEYDGLPEGYVPRPL